MTTQVKPITVLDHIDNIEVPGDVFREPANEYWALVCLWNGLEYLNHQASKCEGVVAQNVNPEGKMRVHMFNIFPGINGGAVSLLTCAFHWYAVTACNYARLVGAIAYRHDDTRPLPPKYVEKVMPEVLGFRDKVAAHFAWATQHSKDTDGERLGSVMPPLTFDDDAFFVGGMTLHIRKAGKVSSSEAIAPWSITKVHEGLRARYWPKPVDDMPPEV
jgi:hypothetical protein